MEERSINEVSSGEDSDVEFLDCGSLRQQRRDLDSPFHDIGDSMMFEESVATEDNARHDQSDQMLRFGSVTKELNVNNKASSKNGKWEYVCKRCYKPGHHLTDCPTNLDPSYDTKPSDRYRCAICGAIEEHYGTLCPKNTAPWSLNQMRLKNRTRARNRQRKGELCHSVSHDSQTRTRVDAGNHSTNRTTESSHTENRRMADFEHNVEYLPEPRCALVDHSQARQQFPIDDREVGQLEENRNTSPPSKRLGREREDTQKQEEHAHEGISGNFYKESRSKRRRLDRSARFGSSQNGEDDCGLSPDILSVVRHDKDKNGRLSYWDDKYDNPHDEEKRTDSKKPRSQLLSDKNIKQRSSGRDSNWEQEMATFDADGFLDGLYKHLVINELVQLRHTAVIHRETLDESSLQKLEDLVEDHPFSHQGNGVSPTVKAAVLTARINPA